MTRNLGEGTSRKGGPARISCSWFESRYPSFESLECPRKFGSLLALVSGLIWLPVTRLVTRNPRGARFTVVFVDEVRARPHNAVRIRATHLSGMDAHPEVQPAFLTCPRSPSRWACERTLEGWRLTKSGPPWLKLGRHVKYDRDGVLAWAREQRRG
jgi:hypothetical protein